MKLFPATIKRGRSLEQKGVSLVEILIYVAILTLFLILIVNMIRSFTDTYRKMRSAQNIELSAETAMERLTRATRDSSSIDTVNSTFDASPGILTLNTTDDEGLAVTVQFLLVGQELHIKESGIDVGPLTPDSARVTNLVFRQITSTQSKAVKIEMTIESGEGDSYASKPFYSTVVLRGSYPLQ